MVIGELAILAMNNTNSPHVKGQFKGAIAVG
jgi:hypothetical protein